MYITGEGVKQDYKKALSFAMLAALNLDEDAQMLIGQIFEYGAGVPQDNKEAFASVLGAKYKYLPIESINSFFAYFIDMLASAFLESYSTVLSNSYLSEEEAEEIAFKCLDENKFYNLKIHYLLTL